jgi:dephospho-CoA kinase
MKQYISKTIFNNKELLKKLNSIVHPAVRKHFLKWEKKKNAAYVIQETALIFENKATKFYDKIVLVVAPESQRIQRVAQRDEISEEQIKNRLKNQLQDDQKIPFAHYVIDNIDLKETEKKVKEVHLAILDFC